MGLLRRVIGLFEDNQQNSNQLNYLKGDTFEDYVLNLFPETYYDVVHATPRTGDFNGRKIESRMYPDFQFRHKPTGHMFWVECKFRGALYCGKIQWCEPGQLERYKRFQEEHRPEKIFIVIGFGGMSRMPNELYCIPLDEIQYPGLYPGNIVRYRRHSQWPFWYSAGRLQ